MNEIDNFIGTKFGPYLQLEVLGWFGEKSGSNKKYTVECSICREDARLYGKATYLMPKSKIKAGRIPCGCSAHTKWTRYQYIVRINRECEERGYSFIAFSGDFKGKDSRIILETPEGFINEVLLSNFMRGQGTISSKNSKIGAKNRKLDDIAVKCFMKTGAYAEHTEFSRSETRLDSKGWKTYWDVFCPVCREIYQSHIGNLSRGTVGCSCSQRRHNKSYIHVISDSDGILAIKYGITSVLNGRRLREQTKSSGLVIESFGTWGYSEVSLCRKAESEVKRLYSNFLTKEILPDGYTETAPYSVVESIVTIFESNGGIRIY